MAEEWQPTGFASVEPIGREAMLGGPWRSPRESLLQRPAGFRGERERRAAGILGVDTVGGLLEHLPHRHEDRGEAKRVIDLMTGEDATVAVEVRTISGGYSRGRGRVHRTVATVADDSGPLEVVWFNQPWVQRQVKVGTNLILHGRYEGRGRFRVAEHEFGSGVGSLTAGLVPVHPAADGLPAKRLRRALTGVRGSLVDVVDPLPGRLIASERLATRPDSLDAIHFPQSEADRELARARLAFEELLLLQLDLQRRRAGRELAGRAVVLGGPGTIEARWLAGLPFEPTGDQARAIAAIGSDLASDRPMSRLLMGEVGSGKTVVALTALLRALECGSQGALMAPTETLAAQHARSVERLLDGLPIPFALLTGSTGTARRREILDRLETGELQLVIGTHALLEPDVRIPRLAVCVVDEQHRFGVRQRELLATRRGEDSSVPHVLHMTATPIPRTLALAAYGDLDTTTLTEMPPGRRPVETHLVSGRAERDRAYARIREEVEAGSRAFVVCPLVEDSDAIEARAAVEERDRLASGPLAGLAVGLLHGRMTTAEKEEAMASFARGDTSVLVSTTVIEVGIDVPEATVMLIEDAERFGLAQLHQLRGRVGRGERGGLCLLCGPKGARRLEAMRDTSDGFRLAELDLELRGEGDLTGLRQSGLPSLRAASLPADLPILERAHAAAGEILARDPRLEGPASALLADALERSASLPSDERIAA